MMLFQFESGEVTNNKCKYVKVGGWWYVLVVVCVIHMLWRCVYMDEYPWPCVYHQGSFEGQNGVVLHLTFGEWECLANWGTKQVRWV